MLLFLTFINHAIRNTKLRLILLSIVCGQVASRRSISLSRPSSRTVHTVCYSLHPLFRALLFGPSPLDDATKTTRRDAFWDKLFERQETALEGAALFSGWPPVQFRSLARQERLPRCHHNVASIFVIDFPSEIPSDTSSARKRSRNKRKGEKRIMLSIASKRHVPLSISIINEIHGPSICCLSYAHSARRYVSRGIITLSKPEEYERNIENCWMGTQNTIRF